MILRPTAKLFLLATVGACWLLVFSIGLNAQTVASQEARAETDPAYTPQVWDIDWSYLAQPGSHQDWTDDLHYIPIGENRANYLSVNGQVRERGEYQDDPGLGSQPPDNGYLLQRYLVSGDLHLESRFRMFLQLESSWINFRDGGPRAGTDKTQLDFNQGFFDIVPWRKSDSENLTVRTGRQLVSLGSTRLVAIGAGLNVEQPFDGVRFTLKAGGWNAQGIALRPVSTNTGIFNNPPNPQEELWGIYLTHNLPHSKKVFADFYYFGLDHKTARYVQGTGREQRQTIGGRIWSHTSTWDYDFEYTGQFGRFGPGNIRAWGSGYHLGYTFRELRFAPHPEIDGGVLTGDHNPHDKTLGTFNPLFPNGNYLNDAILFGPYNLVITRPTLKLDLTRKLASNTNYEFLWRQAAQDGVYNIAGFLVHAPNASRAHFVGSQIQEELDYSFSRHLSGALVYEHFFPGGFLKQSPPAKGLNFISPQLLWNF